MDVMGKQLFEIRNAENLPERKFKKNALVGYLPTRRCNWFAAALRLETAPAAHISQETFQLTTLYDRY